MAHDSGPGSGASLAKAVNEFSINLLKAVVNEKPQDNVLFSPLSVSSCLSMALLGSKGQTESQLLRALRWDQALNEPQVVHQSFQRVLENQLKEDASKPYALTVANRVLVQKQASNPVGENFKRGLTTYYQAVVDDVDFTKDGLRVQEECNRFVEEKTKGNIKTILDSPPDESTRAILLNAIHFKGQWVKAFSLESTYPETFYNHGNEAKDGVDFMHLRDEKFNIGEGLVFGEEKAQVLEMPYKGGLSLIIILPENKDGLQKLISNLSYAQVEDNLGRMTNSKVGVTIPKFKFDSNYSLKPTLVKLGITDAFSDKADFSGINGVRDLCLTEVFHKAAINCDEEGTEASAATAVVMGCLSFTFSLDFRADHPFLFFIRENASKMILFVGKMETF